MSYLESFASIRSCLLYSMAWTSNDFNVETSFSLGKYHSYTGRFLDITRHTRWLLAHRTVPATRADRREINETRRQLQPLQPMLFQRIIDLSSDPSRSYANPCFHVGREMCADGFMQSQNIHRCARYYEIMRPLRAANVKNRYPDKDNRVI